jgi:lipopolysaccharide transport system ATP-binding protein
MKRKEIERKFDEILAFAEIDKFVETPVKHYSSGMYVRLAFSVAAHLEPEILLVDEVLAVGDIAFQRKCLGKIGDVAQQGRTVLFVSHNMGLIQTLCHRGILLQDGHIASDGPIADTLSAYQRTLESAESEDLASRTDRRGKGRVRLIKVDILDGSDGPAPVLVTGEPARFVFHLSGLINGLSCVFTLVNQLGQRIVNFKSDTPGLADATRPEIGASFICEVNPLLLMPGRYRLNVLLRGGGEWQDYVEAAKIFDVEGGSLDGRQVKANYEISVCMPHRWTLPQ